MDAFKKRVVWKRSSRLCVELYQSLNTCRDLGFKDQITRSAPSVPSNIAEGYERDSANGFSRFLRIAKGSCGELRTQLYIGAETGLLDRAFALSMVAVATEISKILQGLIKRCNTA